MPGASNSRLDNAPLVSVIVPVYNAEAYLRQTCESILAQTFTDIEILLVDDHSSDESLKLMREYADRDHRIRALQPPERCGGPAGPRNFGVSKARGVYVAFCDSDDLWMPDKLAVQLDLIERSGAAMCSTELVRFHNSVDLDGYRLEEDPAWRRIGLLENQIKNKIVTSSVIVDRDTLIRHPFNTAPHYRVVEDYDCWLRVIEEKGYCAKILYPLVAYRICDSQISSNKWKQIVRVFGVHWRYGKLLSRPSAFLFAATHVLVAAYQRALGKSV